jgi:hypothetical protein
VRATDLRLRAAKENRPAGAVAVNEKEEEINYPCTVLGAVR